LKPWHILDQILKKKMKSPKKFEERNIEKFDRNGEKLDSRIEISKQRNKTFTYRHSE
jgi:hypothetical protein